MKALKRITSPEYVQNFISKRHTTIKFYESEIQKEYKSYEFDYDLYKNNAVYIRNVLDL